VRHASGPYGVHVPGTVHPSQAPGQPMAGPSSLGGTTYTQYLRAGGSSPGSATYYDSSRAGARTSAGQLSGPGVPGSAPSYPPYAPAAHGYAHFPPLRYSFPTGNPDYPPHPPPPHGYPSPESWAPSEGRHTPPEPPVYAPHRDLSRNLPPLALDESRRPNRFPPLEPIPPPRHWPPLDASPQSPASYRAPGFTSPSRPVSSPIVASQSPTLSILPRLRIPSPRQTRSSDDRTLAPLTFPPPPPSRGGYSPPGSAHGSYVLARDIRPSPVSRRDSTTSFDPRHEYQPSPPISTRGVQLSPLSLRAPQGPPPESLLPAEGPSSPQTPYEVPSSSPTVGRGHRFDPVRAAISDNESHGGTPPTEAHS
jgi:hypothetical protein